MTNLPPPGSKRVSDWIGKKVVTTQVMRNGHTEIPAGLLCEVTYARCGLTLKSQACTCCGVAIYIRRVSTGCVRLEETL